MHGNKLAIPGPSVGIPPMVATNLLGVIGASTILLLPGLVGLMAETLELTPSQVGWVASADVATMGITWFFVALVIHLRDWRRLAFVSLAVLAAGYAWSAFAGSFESMLLARLLSGIGEGGATAVAFAVFGTMRNPDRQFGIYLVCALSFGALGLLVLPSVAEVGGQALVFGVLLGLVLVTAMAAGSLPRGLDADILDAAAPRLPYLLVGLGLATVFLYFLAQGDVWAYLERIGNASGLSPSVVGQALAISSLAGILGAFTATLINTRFGRAIPLTLSAVISIVSLVVLFDDVSALEFISVAAMFNYAWNLSQPLFSGLMAELDAKGRAVVMMGAIQTIGVGVGPGVAALFVGDGLDPVIVIGVVAIALSQALVLTLIYLSRTPSSAS